MRCEKERRRQILLFKLVCAECIRRNKSRAESECRPLLIVSDCRRRVNQAWMRERLRAGGGKSLALLPIDLVIWDLFFRAIEFFLDEFRILSKNWYSIENCALKSILFPTLMLGIACLIQLKLYQGRMQLNDRISWNCSKFISLPPALRYVGIPPLTEQKATLRSGEQSVKLILVAFFANQCHYICTHHCKYKRIRVSPGLQPCGYFFSSTRQLSRVLNINWFAPLQHTKCGVLSFARSHYVSCCGARCLCGNQIARVYGRVGVYSLAKQPAAEVPATIWQPQ